MVSKKKRKRYIQSISEPSNILVSEAVAEPSPFSTTSSLVMAATATAEAAASASASESCKLTDESFGSLSKRSEQSFLVAERLWEICTSDRLEPGAPIPCETTRLLAGRIVGDVTAPG